MPMTFLALEANCIGYDDRLPLNPRERLILSEFHRSGFVPKTRLYDVLWPNTNPTTKDIMLAQFIRLLRDQLEPFGLTIETRHGNGYYMCDEDRDMLDSFVA